MTYKPIEHIQQTYGTSVLITKNTQCLSHSPSGAYKSSALLDDC